jgi:N-dimethylarginine dimethylaminohydrolase
MTNELSESAPLVHVVVKHARDAFVDEATVAAQWRPLGFTAAPDLGRAIAESDRFIELLREAGAQVHLLPRDATTTLDSIYVHDACALTPRGVVFARMGKAARAGELAAQEVAGLHGRGAGLPVAGRIEPPGLLEGGDIVWLDDRTVAIGVGYRTNREGIRQFAALAGDGIDVVEVPLPHWRGAGDVMHLMSLLSPIDRDAAVVYSPLLPVPFRTLLLERGYALVDVPDEEFDSMGTNVLALAPRRVVVLAGNRRTRAALERAGADVREYEGVEISVKGAGGPTCLTRPLVRRPQGVPDVADPARGR